MKMIWILGYKDERTGEKKLIEAFHIERKARKMLNKYKNENGKFNRKFWLEEIPLNR